MADELDCRAELERIYLALFDVADRVVESDCGEREREALQLRVEALYEARDTLVEIVQYDGVE